MDPPAENEHGGLPEIHYQIGMMRESLRSVQELVRERRAAVPITDEKITQLTHALQQTNREIELLQRTVADIAASVQSLLSLRRRITALGLAFSSIGVAAAGLWFYFGASLMKWLRQP